MAKDPASHAHERQNALPRALGVRGRPVQTLRAERIAEDLTPTTQVTKAAALGACHKFVPCARITVEC